MSAILLLSNGHGEDLSAAAVGRELMARGWAVEALPLVGHGQAYRRAGIPLVTPTRHFSTGGLGYTSLAARLTDLREGQVSYVLTLLAQLWRRRRRYRMVVAVGDVVPLLGAWLSGRPAAIYLVAYSSHYEGRLRLPWPCGWLLRRPRIRAVWSRDRLTADDLTQQLGRPVHFLGNPFLDPQGPALRLPPPPAEATARPKADAAERAGEERNPPVVAVVPGSRPPEALANLALLLQVLQRLPEAGGTEPEPLLQAALVEALEPEAVAAVAAPLGWRWQAMEGEPAKGGLLGHNRRLELHWGRFEAVLASSDVVLAMGGTASEQAVALGRPVLQVAGAGPQFTAGFAEAQRRLLGAGVCCAPGPVGQPATLTATAIQLRAMLSRWRDPVAGPPWRAELQAIAAERLGGPGGSTRIAAAIATLL